jgi:hypothetical protein
MRHASPEIRSRRSHPAHPVDIGGKAIARLTVVNHGEHVALQRTEPPVGGREIVAKVSQSRQNPLPGGDTRHGRKVRFLEQPWQNGARHTHCRLHPFHVPAQPEEVVGRPAGQVEGGPADIQVRRGRRQEAELRGRTVGQHPRVLAAPAALHGRHQFIQRRGEARQSAWHDGIGAGRGNGIDPEHEVARAEYAVFQYRHRR